MKIIQLFLLCLLAQICFSQNEAKEQNSLYLKLIPVSEENSRQYLVMGNSEKIIDTLGEFPSSDVLIDYVIESETMVTHIIAVKDDWQFFYTKSSKENSPYWVSLKSFGIGKDHYRSSSTGIFSSPGAPIGPITFKLQDANTVLRVENGEEKVVDIADYEARQKAFFNPKK